MNTRKKISNKSQYVNFCWELTKTKKHNTFQLIILILFQPALFKVNNGNIKTMYKILSKSVVKTPEQHQWHRSQWLRCSIFNPAVPCSKPLGGSKVDSAVHPSEVDKMNTRDFWELVVKSKLPPRSGSSHEAVEPHP